MTSLREARRRWGSRLLLLLENVLPATACLLLTGLCAYHMEWTLALAFAMVTGGFLTFTYIEWKDFLEEWEDVGRG